MRTFKLSAVIVMMALMGACNNGKPVSAKGKQPPSCPAVAAKAVSQPMMTGVVVETINASSYTYVSINTGKETVWAAAPTVTLKKGDTVSFDPGMPMTNHVSKTLNRTFPLVYFTSGFSGKAGNELSKIKLSNQTVCPAVPASSQEGGSAASKPIDFKGIAKPANGKSVAELFLQKKSLVGKKVTLRGRVVKANYGILGKTWLHVQDGTGKDGSNDLTVTTTDVTPKKGDLVLVEGPLNVDKDIGSGYKFPVIIEDAAVKVEKK